MSSRDPASRHARRADRALGAVVVGLLIVFALVASALELGVEETVIFELDVPVRAASAVDSTLDGAFYTRPFTVAERPTSIRVDLRPAQGSVDAAVALINEDTAELHEVEITNGSRIIDRVDPGRYSLRVDARGPTRSSARLSVVQAPSSPACFLVTLCALLLPAALLVVRRRRRGSVSARALVTYGCSGLLLLSGYAAFHLTGRDFASVEVERRSMPAGSRQLDGSFEVPPSFWAR